MSNKKTPDSKVFCEGSSFPRHRLKQRLITEKIVEYKCQMCGLGDMWNGKKISLHIDHINGIANDNRLVNLQFLCPNCHSQTDTYAGKNSKGFRGSGLGVKENYRKTKSAADKKLWELVRPSIAKDLGWGWKTRAAEMLAVTPQNVIRWIKRVDPEFVNRNTLL